MGRTAKIWVRQNGVKSKGMCETKGTEDLNPLKITLWQVNNVPHHYHFSVSIVEWERQQKVINWSICYSQWPY